MDRDHGPLLRSIKLAAARKAKRLSLRELGKIVGCSAAHLNDIELGNRNPSPRLKAKLDKALEIEE